MIFLKFSNCLLTLVDSLSHRLRRAKEVWSCKACICKPTLAGALSGFIECSICSHWFHIQCCDNINDPAGSNYLQQPPGGGVAPDPATHPLQTYVCTSCQSGYGIASHDAQTSAGQQSVLITSQEGGRQAHPYAQDILIGL